MPRRTNNKAGADRCKQVWWALTDPDAALMVRLQQWKHELAAVDEEQAEIDSACALDGWTKLYRSEAERLAKIAEERRAEIQRMEEWLKKRGVKDVDSAVVPPGLPRRD